MVPPGQQCRDNRPRRRLRSGVAANLEAALAGRISEARPQLAVPDAHHAGGRCRYRRLCDGPADGSGSCAPRSG